MLCIRLSCANLQERFPMTEANPKRRTRVAVTGKETQEALNALIVFADADKVSPSPGAASSANAVLQQLLEVTDNRAGYLLDILAKAGAIERIEHSHKVRILRSTVVCATPTNPSLSMADYTKMRTALIALDKESEEQRDRIKQLEGQVAELLDQLSQVAESHVAIDADVLSILQRHSV